MITASEDYQAWRCGRCGMLNTRLQFNCGRCKADAPIPPAIDNRAVNKKLTCPHCGGVVNTRNDDHITMLRCDSCGQASHVSQFKITSRASAAPALTSQEVEKAQQELLRSVREIGHVS